MMSFKYAGTATAILLLLVLQSPVSAWWFRWDGGANANEQCFVVAMDPQGDVVVAGYYKPSGNNVLRVAKHAQLDGSTLWTRTWDPGLGSHAQGVATDNEGNVYVCGGYFDTDHDWVVIKYDANGTELARGYFDSGYGDEDAAGVATDPSGNAIVVGWCKNSTGNNVWRVVKYDSSLDTLWTRTWDSGLGSHAQGVATDNEGNVYVCGGYFDTDHDWVVIKYDANGTELARGYFDSGYGDEDAAGVATDPSGNAIVVGWCKNSTGNNVWRVAKYDSSLDTLWTQTWDPGLGSDAQGVSTDNEGIIYVCGAYFNPETGDHDWKVLKYDPDGTVVRDAYFDEGFQAGEADAKGIAVGGGYCAVVGTSTASGTLLDWQVWHYDTEQLAVTEKVSRTRLVQPSDIVCTPNPCASITRLAWTLPRDARISASIYNEQGARIAVLFDGTPQTHGVVAATWDGRDDRGHLASPGTYFVRLWIDDGSEKAVKILVVR